MNELKQIREKGFTLIEMLIALVLVSILIFLNYQYFHSVNLTFDITNKQSELQWATRLAKIKIEKEVKFAKSVEILSSIPDQESLNETTSEIEKVLCVEVEDGNGKLEVLTHSSSTNLLGSSADSINMSISFQKAIPDYVGENLGNSLLGFELESIKNGESYGLASEVHLYNNPAISATVASGTVLRYVVSK